MELLKWCRLQWDRVCAVIGFVAGAVLLVVGWVGVSGVVYPAEQIPYVVSAGFGGLFLLGIGGTLWHSADLRDQWRTLDRIEQHLENAEATVVEPSSLHDLIDRPTLRSEARR
jgi:hypothetical protein